jgi:hypothetical protein
MWFELNESNSGFFSIWTFSGYLKPKVVKLSKFQKQKIYQKYFVEFNSAQVFKIRRGNEKNQFYINRRRCFGFEF